MPSRTFIVLASLAAAAVGPGLLARATDAGPGLSARPNEIASQPIAGANLSAVASAKVEGPANETLQLQATAAQAPAPSPAPASPGRAERPGPAPAAAPRSAAAPNGAMLKQYCLTCHSERVKSGGLVLEGLDASAPGSHAATWEKVVRKIRTGMMPPSGSPRPARHELDALATALEQRLDQTRPAGAQLASSTLHRLNRTEYGNAIRDLLGLEADVSTLLPADGSNHGFDNLAEGLSMSPTLVQAYVAAAMKISRQAVGDPTTPESTVTYNAPPALAQDQHVEGLPLGTRGGMIVHHNFPLDAEYEISASGGADITIDGEPLPAGAAPGGRGGALGPAAGAGPGRGAAPGPGAGAPPGAAGAGAPAGRGGAAAAAGGGAGRGGGAAGGRGGAATRQRVKITAGPHAIGAAVVDRTRRGGADDIYSDFRTDSTFTVAGGVTNISITGPFNPTGVGDTPSRRRIFTCKPTGATDEAACARKILSGLARRAYRGPVSATEVATLMTFFEQGRRDGSFESGIQHALARILVAPRFIYRIEQPPARLAAGAVYRISDLDLASRLSFFLWSSIPDDELLRVAEQGTLRTPAVLKKQVARMLADPKSAALTRNFAGQWLYLRELDSLQTEAKHFDDSLRQSFRKETELLFESIVKEDRSLIELLDADYTFVDERLARHYGIANVRGSYFRRVTLDPQGSRRGLLGHGSMLTVTSIATRTSPVARGKWILENLFGAPPPEPPPGVETNLEQPPNEKPTTLRRRLELHRTNPTCASCHRIMDPIGFALENFDLVGAWRETDNGSPIDSTGQLADGTALKGAADLREALLSRSDAFIETVTEKLLTYATGRPMSWADMPDVRAIAHRTTAGGNRFSVMLMGVIESDQFQKRVKAN
jgi:hypothetical protein